MFKLPSLRSVTDELVSTITRFQWVSIAAICKMAILIRMSEAGSNEMERNFMTRLSYPAFLAVPLFFAVYLVSERKNWPAQKRFLVNAAVLLVLVLYYFFLSDKTETGNFYRFMLFIVSAHLIATFIPFFGESEINGFWQYNKTLFLQFLNASLYSITLYLGLLVAVETVQFLFHIKYTFNIEADLAILIFTLFHTIFFLSKIPRALDRLDQETDYPSGLKIFTQYVLLPLEVIYLIILYTYTCKIIIEWRLPEGGVAYLVLAFSIAGILALLLLFPLRKNQHERWIRLFSKRFYLALLPLIVLLFVGIFRRIQDYGMTENRYLIVVLAFWLAGVTGYFLLSKKEDIRRIPISLSLICLLLPVGPWNILTIAKASQLSQFDRVLRKHKLLDAEGKITGTKAIPGKDYDQLVSIISFFRNREEEGLESYFPKTNTLTNSEKEKWEHFNTMQEYFSLHVKNKTTLSGYDDFNNFRISANQTISIAGFQNLLQFDANNLRKHAEDKQGWRIEKTDNSHYLSIYQDERKVVSFNLEEKTEELAVGYAKNSENVPITVMTFDYNDNGGKIRVVLSSLFRNGNSYYCTGFLLY